MSGMRLPLLAFATVLSACTPIVESGEDCSKLTEPEPIESIVVTARVAITPESEATVVAICPDGWAPLEGSCTLDDGVKLYARALVEEENGFGCDVWNEDATPRGARATVTCEIE
jgi:hypothetical protein